MSLHNKTEDWEEEFDKKFDFDGVTYLGHRHWKDGVKENLVKSFISKILLKQKEELVEGMEKLRE